MNGYHSRKSLLKMTTKELLYLGFEKDVDEDGHMVEGFELGDILEVLNELKEEGNILERRYVISGNSTDEMIHQLKYLLTTDHAEGFYVLNEINRGYHLEHYSVEEMMEEILDKQDEEMEEIVEGMEYKDTEKFEAYINGRHKEMDLATALSLGLDIEFSLHWFKSINEAIYNEMEEYVETARKLRTMFN